MKEPAQQNVRMQTARLLDEIAEPHKKRLTSKGRQLVSLQPLVASAAASVLSLLILTCILQIWNADLAILPSTKGDVIVVAMSVKSMIDNGWWLRNPHLGMPFGQQLYDVPFVDNLTMLTLKLMSLCTSRYAVIMNTFYFLTFPLTALTSLWVFRSFAISYTSAVVLSLLYTFLPYHFLRGEHHLFLSAYYVVPLIMMICLWLWTDGIGLSTRRIVYSLVSTMLIGSGENYYAFFACFLLCIAGVGGSLAYRKLRPLAFAIGLSAFIVIIVGLNNAPSLFYQWRHGANNVASLRGPEEAELYGLKISQLLLPVDGHRVQYLARLKNYYNSIAPSVNENSEATLGVVADCGLLYLLAQLLWRHEQICVLVRPLSSLAAASVLLGTIGGFGVLFNLICYAQFRSYNRISVYIAFMSLFAVALLLDAFGRELTRRGVSAWLWYGALAGTLLIGVFDQTSAAFVPQYLDARAEDLNDAEFIKKIEALVPRGAMIFQLPVVAFPTNPPIRRMVDYDLLKGYLHSSSLRWSYGSVKGREEALWGECLALQPVDWLVWEVIFAGFSGIYVDRYGYSDSASSLESRLSHLLGEVPLVSDNGRLAFFSLTSLAASMRAKSTATEWRARQGLAIKLSQAPIRCRVR